MMTTLQNVTLSLIIYSVLNVTHTHTFFKDNVFDEFNSNGIP